jgi:hypothetical protein
MIDLDMPFLPYAETSGHGGNGASKARAEREDADGTTTARQREALAYLDGAAEWGVTWKELGDSLKWHAGQSSGCLSVLHKEGVIARLANKRLKCSVYVLPQYVLGREESPHGSHRPKLCDRCLCEVGA